MKPLILHVMASRAQGGAETHAGDVILALHRAGVRQVVVMPRDAIKFQELKAAGMDMVPDIFNIPFRPWQKFLMRRLIRSRKPDLVHCWMRRGASLTPKLNIPVIGWFGGYYHPKNFKSCTQFVAVTDDIVAHTVGLGVAKNAAHCIPVLSPAMPDTALVARDSFDTPARAKIILTLSRLHPKKGIDTFLNAIKDMPDCYAWIAGDGPLRGAMEKLARDLGIESRVRFLGWRMDRWALLSACDICVLPSRYEPFGAVIIEAWQAGKPFVACNSAGPRATIEDGVTGLLTPIDDVAGLRQAMRRALDDGELRDRLIENGLHAYKKHYAPDVITQRWTEFYDRAIKGGAG